MTLVMEVFGTTKSKFVFELNPRVRGQLVELDGEDRYFIRRGVPKIWVQRKCGGTGVYTMLSDKQMAEVENYFRRHVDVRRR